MLKDGLASSSGKGPVSWFAAADQINKAIFVVRLTAIHCM